MGRKISFKKKITNKKNTKKRNNAADQKESLNNIKNSIK